MRPCFGMAGSKKVEMCSQHALDDMVDVASKTCSHPNCPNGPSYGSKETEMCTDHAMDEMFNEVRPPHLLQNLVLRRGGRQEG